MAQGSGSLDVTLLEETSNLGNTWRLTGLEAPFLKKERMVFDLMRCNEGMTLREGHQIVDAARSNGILVSVALRLTEREKNSEWSFNDLVHMHHQVYDSLAVYLKKRVCRFAKNLNDEIIPSGWSLKEYLLNYAKNAMCVDKAMRVTQMRDMRQCNDQKNGRDEFYDKTSFEMDEQMQILHEMMCGERNSEISDIVDAGIVMAKEELAAEDCLSGASRNGKLDDSQRMLIIQRGDCQRSREKVLVFNLAKVLVLLTL